ncbi:MAG: hypothetical protein AABZ39_11010 [Spirochaetota bacterium]
MKKEVEAILAELREIDPSFKPDGKSRELIETLLSAKPKAKIDAAFRAQLRKDILARASRKRTTMIDLMMEHRRIVSIAAILIAAIVSAPVITVLMRDRNAFSRDERQSTDDRIAPPARPEAYEKAKRGANERLSSSTQSEVSPIGSIVKEEKARTRAAKGASPVPADDAETEHDKDKAADTALAQTKKADMRREAFAENADEGLASPKAAAPGKSAAMGASIARAGENPFLAREQYSGSTFTCGPRSAAMNTLSQYLRAKRMPPAQAVTPEGLINTAGYSDDIPPIAVTHTACQWNTAHTLLVVAIGRPSQGEVITVAFSEAVREYRLIANGSIIPSGPNACIAVYEIVPAGTVDTPILARATRGAPTRSALAAPAITELSSAPMHVRYAAALAEFGLLVSGSAYKGTADHAHAIALAEETRITDSIVSMMREMKAAAEKR